MAKLTPDTIVLRGKGIRKEGDIKLSTTISPGMLVARDSNGDMVPHAVAAAPAVPAFAVENEIVGKGIDDNYVSTASIKERLLYEVLNPGSEVYAWLPANAAAIVRGDKLESNGDGRLRKAAGAAGVRASVTIGTGNAAVEFQAVEIGEDGNDIRVQYLAGTAATATVTVNGTLIQVKPDTTTPGTTDQAADVVTLVNGSPEASALVVARNGDGGDGTSAVVTPVAATNLAGGVSAEPGQPVVEAKESVDNSAGGSPARIKVEVF